MQKDNKKWTKEIKKGNDKDIALYPNHLMKEKVKECMGKKDNEKRKGNGKV